MAAGRCGGGVFRIRVQPKLDPQWAGWLGGIAISPDESEGLAGSVLVGSVPDQAALRGVLSRLWDLNLVVLSVERMEPGERASRPAGLHETTSQAKGDQP